MSFRPARKIFPASKLTADNAGDLELTSHRRAVACASAALLERPVVSLSRSLSPLPGSSPPPPTNTEDATDDALSQTRSSSKCSLSQDSIIVVSPTTSDVASDPAPNSKRVKPSVVPEPPIPPEPPIIDIDDIDDPREELLNITDPTADISHFFTLAPRVPGQPKTRMKCESCA
jgi:hypothetical protein